ncbi:polysaccharide deacetylase [Clostridium sp. SHJSY1]|uniref:polysaccharide deacetylase family protein n=1 Tax=Clostridium sp. SHJSY1 TaxID=2942483 RepID=UPI0028771835|nr:polysaccharide deacetylase family protein [Clostridium sp. SHJSY1]MDS0528102.1 polysaccharide deacetylase [Clostridium sp. SHJSY1]
MWGNKIKKRVIQQRRERYKRATKKRMIVSIAIIITIIGCAFLAKMKFESDKEKIYTKAEIVDDSVVSNKPESEDTSKVVEDSNLDNSGYLPLEKDPDAEDAVELFHTTDKLIKNEIKYPVRTDGKKVAYLTFDDGPATTNTPKVLDILKKNGIKATFMIMGKNAELNEKSKEILKRTVKEGHAIGNHTYCHDYKYLYPSNVISVDHFISDVDKCNKTLKNILGKDFNTRVIRFPAGYWNWEGRTAIKPVIEEKGYGSINWNALSEDGQGKPNKTANELIEISKKNLDLLGKDADSVVFLMHDTYGKEETVKSLQSIIDMFKERGFEFKTIK